jgi:hypothetical protein
MSKKVGRNDLCPCGSGLKFKKCCIDKDERINGQAALANYPLNEAFGGRDAIGADFDEDQDALANKINAMRGKRPEELFKILEGLGLPVTKEIMIEDAARVDSVVDLCQLWQDRYRSMDSMDEDEMMWAAAKILWEKLDPAGTPCLETIFDKIVRGYECLSKKSSVANAAVTATTAAAAANIAVTGVDAAIEIWTEAWNDLKTSLGRVSRTFNQLNNQIFMPDNDSGFKEWTDDFCGQLAGLIKERGDDYKMRIEKFADELMTVFSDAPETAAVQARMKIAKTLFAERRPAEADAYFETLAADYPRCLIIYEHWAGAYSGKIFDKTNILQPDYEKARVIAMRGASIKVLEGRGRIIEIVRQLNRVLFREKRLNAEDYEAARAAYEFERTLSGKTLKEQLNALDELCIESSMRSFERFVDPAPLYKKTVSKLAGSGMINEALGLSSILYLRQQALYAENYETFDRLSALAAIVEGKADRAEQIVLKFITDASPDYDSIESIISFAAIYGMEKRFAGHCERAVKNFAFFEAGRRNRRSESLLLLAIAALFEKTFVNLKNGEKIDEKSLSDKLFEIGLLYEPNVIAKLFTREIIEGRSYAALGENFRRERNSEKYYDMLIKMSFHYFKHMYEQQARSFVVSSIIWEFTASVLINRMQKMRIDAGFENVCKLSGNDLKKIAFERCSDFGHESDQFVETVIGLRGMKSVFEFLRDAGAIDESTCFNVCAAAEWTLAKLLKTYETRSWQLGFVEKL